MFAVNVTTPPPLSDDDDATSLMTFAVTVALPDVAPPSTEVLPATIALPDPATELTPLVTEAPVLLVVVPSTPRVEPLVVPDGDIIGAGGGGVHALGDPAATAAPAGSVVVVSGTCTYFPDTGL